jgi:dihydroneopterin aldolase
MSNAIRIRGMRFWGKHGALSGEQEKSQPIDLDIELDVDCAPAVASDQLADAVDYAKIYKTCERVVTTRSFALLEALAYACLHAVLEDKRIRSATIRVRKPRLLDGATPEVELTRTGRSSDFGE